MDAKSNPTKEDDSARIRRGQVNSLNVFDKTHTHNGELGKMQRLVYTVLDGTRSFMT